MDRPAVGVNAKIKISGDAMNIVDMLIKKRNGKKFSIEEIH